MMFDGVRHGSMRLSVLEQILALMFVSSCAMFKISGGFVFIGLLPEVGKICTICSFHLALQISEIFHSVTASSIFCAVSCLA